MQIDALKPYASWLSDHAASLDQLRYQVARAMIHLRCADTFVIGNITISQGLRVGSLPPFIGPVFTFSNASSCRANYDEVNLFFARTRCCMICKLVTPAGIWNGDDG